MEYPFPRLCKNHTSYCIIYGVIIDFVAKKSEREVREIRYLMDEEKGRYVQTDLKIADFPRAVPGFDQPFSSDP